MRSQTTNICGPYFLIVPNDSGCNYNNVSFLALASVVWNVDGISNYHRMGDGGEGIAGMNWGWKD